MLAFITTDVVVEPKLLKHALRIAVEQSFDRITVDGRHETQRFRNRVGEWVRPKSENRESRFKVGSFFKRRSTPLVWSWRK